MNRTLAPAPQKSAPFKIPELKSFRLTSGLEINFVSMRKLPIVFTEAVIFSGSKFDPMNKKGMSYLTSLLIDEGAGEYNSLQLSEEFEKLGTILNVGSNHDTIILSILSMKENYERSLELLSKIILQPRFDEEDFNREKKKVLSRILQLKDEPSFIASAAFERRVFGNTFYGFPEIGYEETIGAINNNDIKNFYKQTITSSNTKIITVGSMEESETSELFSRHFGNWNSHSEQKINFEVPAGNKTKFYFVHKPDSAQSEIRIGHIAKKRDSGDYIQSKIMNTILGGQFSSRINLNLRERKGFTYGASSSFHYYKECGLFEVSTAVNVDNSGEAVSEIFNELNGIRENISAEEIEFAKSYLIKQFPSRFETYNQIAKNFESLIIHSLTMDELTNYTDKLETSTPEQIKQSALNNILPDEMTVVVVGDRGKVIEQLKKVLGQDPIELDIRGNLIT